MKRMKRGKVIGPDGISEELWNCLCEWSLDFLMRLFTLYCKVKRCLGNGEVYWYQFARTRVMCRSVVSTDG